MSTPVPFNPNDPKSRMGAGSVSYNPVMARASQAQQQNSLNIDEYNNKLQSIQTRSDEATRALNAAMADNRPGKPLDFLPDWAQTPLENTFSGMYWAYSKFISQPLTFSILAQRQLRAYMLDDDIWHAGSKETMSVRDLWNNSRNFSPAQAVVISNMNAKLLDKEKLNVTDPLAGKWNNEQFFDQGPMKYFTGTLDAAISWYTDPLVLLGKGLAVTKQVTMTKSVTKEMEKFADAAGKVDFEAMAMTKNSNLARMVDFVEKTKLKSDDPRSLLRMSSLKNSPRGMDLASALSMAKSRDEITDVLRVSMGDIELVGAMRGRNAKLASAMYSLSRNTSALNISGAALTNPVNKLMYQQAISNQTALLSAMERESGFLSRAVGHDDEAFGAVGALTNLNFNRYTSPAMLSFRNAIANAPRFRGDGQPSNFFAKVVYTGLYSTPLRIFRLPGDIMPPRYLDLHSQESWRGLEATMRNVRSISREDQADMIASYIKAAPGERAKVLAQIEAKAIGRMADSHLVDPQTAREMYMHYAGKRGMIIEQGKGRRFSNGKIEDPNNPGVMIYADEFTEAGEVGMVHPIMAPQLKNNHVLMDFSTMDKVLRLNGTNFGKARQHAGRIPGAVSARVDVLNRYWKAGQLLSLRYGIRAISDDLMSQTARYGSMAMIARAGEGTKNLSNRIARGTWQKNAVEGEAVQLHIARQDLKEAEKDILKYERKVQESPGPYYEEALADARSFHEETTLGIAEMERKAAIRAADKPIITRYGDGNIIIEPAYGGVNEGLTRSLVTNSKGWDNLMGPGSGNRYKQMSTGEFRSVRLAEGEEAHMDAWSRIIKRQFSNDPLAKRILAGDSEDALRNWLARDPAGRAHFKSLQVNNMSHEDLIERAMADIEHVLPPTMPGREAVAEAVVTGSRLPANALKDVPPLMRPQELRLEMTNTMVGTNALSASIDNAIDGFYKFANQLPAEKLSRSPLFAAQYSFHVEDVLKSFRASGAEHLTPTMRRDVARLARERSLNDVKRFSFNMDFESRMAHAARFVSPFFGATLESWMRWGRVIGDVPSTIPHAGMLFSSPTRAGWTVDAQGNKIDPDGYSTNPVTGERRLVPKSEQTIRVQMPQWAVKGMEKLTGLAIPEYDMPLDSMNVVLQGDPVYNPGFGPFVQIPIQQFADLTPNMEEGFRELGLLPYNSRGVLGGAAWMKEAYNAVTGTGMDQDMISVLRRQQYEYDNGMRSEKPNVEEARKNARKMSMLKMIQKFALPMGVSNQRGVEVKGEGGDLKYEPIRMFVDEYNKMLKLDPQGAQDKFLDKYGASFFAFTTAMSKTNSTVPSTTGGGEVEMKYKALLSEVDPDLGGLIAGPEGGGPYSSGAYYYQLDNETHPGSGVMKREKLTPQQWIDENSRKAGWRLYRQSMLTIQAKLLEAGFQTFEDKGAEEFALLKKATVNTLISPTVTDDNGKQVPNQFYNKHWEKDYNSQDRGFYDRRVSEMRVITDYFNATDQISAKNPSGDGKILVRADIHGLREYIANRDAVTNELDGRKSQDINAKSNLDLKDAFIRSTMDIMERYIPFAELHSRYLARDMGIDVYTKAVAQ